MTPTPPLPRPLPQPARRRHRVRAVVVAALAVAALLAACAHRPMPDSVAAEPVDLRRFMGAWHVIAHVPYFGERGHVASVDEYTLRDDGDIDVRYRYREGFAEPRQQLESRATVHAGSGNRLWTTWFFRVVPTKFRILEVAPDYSWALIDYPGRNLAWIFGREPVMDDALYRDLERRIAAHGVDTDRMRRVPQVPAQVGKLGFARPKVHAPPAAGASAGQ